MPLAHISQTGNISIPKAWRDELGIAPNSKVIIEKRGNEIIIEPLSKKDYKLTMKEIREEFKKKGLKFTREEAIRDDLYD